MPENLAIQIEDGRGGWLTPGLIDAHTHAVFAGDRSREFAERLNGASYEEIARKGGGILSTVAATRAASEQELLEVSLKRVRTVIREGTTTLEVKSGYGLTLADELKKLRMVRAIVEHLPLRVHKTFLGAHAVPPEYQGRADAYVTFLVEEVLPVLHEEKQLPLVALLREHGVGIGLATDCNPGTSPVLGLTAVMNMGCTLFRLTPEESFPAVTSVGARALGLGQQVGVLRQGMRADMALWDVTGPHEPSYWVVGGCAPCDWFMQGYVFRICPSLYSTI